MAIINICLVGEGEDRLFSGIEVDNQIIYNDLKKMIETLTNVPKACQILHFRGEKISLAERPIEDIKFGEEIVVEHSLLEYWRTYLKYFEAVKDIKIAKSERTTFARRAIANSKRLEDFGFFEAYIKVVPLWIDTYGQLMRFVDGTQEAFEQSATKYFTKMFPNSTIDFNPKQGGSRAGIVVNVTCNGEKTTYYMKTYHLAGPSSFVQNTTKRHLPDLREMFAYRLLEVIGVGPPVFFPFYDGSTYIHYIATKEVEDLTEVDKIEDTGLQKKLVVEAYLLSLLIGIRDLNEGNFGSNKDGALAIIDFFVPKNDIFQRRNILDDFKRMNTYGATGEPSDILNAIGHEERIKIAKDALPNWSRIRSITTDIIADEKSELRKHGIIFGTATHDVENYLGDIKLNYESMCSGVQ